MDRNPEVTTTKARSTVSLGADSTVKRAVRDRVAGGQGGYSRGMWVTLVLLVVGFGGLAVIGSHWHRWGYDKAMGDLREATDNFKVEVGKTLVPAVQRIEAGHAALLRRFGITTR